MPVIVISWLVVGGLTGLFFYLFTTRVLKGGLLAWLVTGLVSAAASGYLVATATGLDIMAGPVTWGNLIVTFLGALAGLLIVRTVAEKPRRR